MLGGLGQQHHIIDDLLFGHVARFHCGGNLLFHQRRPDIAGRNAIYRYAKSGQFQRGGFGQAGNAMLGRDIGGFERRSHQRMGRSRVDDAAPFARLHARNGCPQGVKGRGQVDGQNLIPFLDGKFFDRCHILDAGIVDQNVERAEFGFRLMNHGRNFVRPGHIRCRIMTGHLEISLYFQPFGLNGRSLAKTIDDNIRAFRGQRPCIGQTNTGC